MDLSQITPEDFEAILDQTVSLKIEDQIVAARVSEVRRLRAHGLRSGTPFSLVLHVGGDARLKQGTHVLVHPSRGEFPLFMVPIGPDARGQRYEATFN